MIEKAWVRAWASRYPSDDEAIRGLAGKARPSHRDVEFVVRWKSARSLGYFGRNKPSTVQRTVSRALREADPDVALGALTELAGVKERIASAVLAAFRPEDYTVMDIRAWRSLRAHGLMAQTEHWSWRARWRPYLEECRRTSKRLGVSLRTLDRALWAAAGRAGMP